MTLPLRRVAIAVGVGGIVLLAFALGWWGGDDGGRRPATAAAAPAWLLPKPIASDMSSYAQILAQNPPFGALAPNPISAEPQPTGSRNAALIEWRVGGIVMTETSRHLIILIRRPGENTIRSEIRHSGETLPDGSIVRTLEPANVTIDRQGAIVTIKMFAQN